VSGAIADQARHKATQRNFINFAKSDQAYLPAAGGIGLSDSRAERQRETQGF